MQEASKMHCFWWNSQLWKHFGKIQYFDWWKWKDYEKQESRYLREVVVVYEDCIEIARWRMRTNIKILWFREGHNKTGNDNDPTMRAILEA